MNRRTFIARIVQTAVAVAVSPAVVTFCEAWAPQSVVLWQHRKVMARVRITPEAMSDSMRSEGAFIEAYRSEFRKMVADMQYREEDTFR